MKHPERRPLADVPDAIHIDSLADSRAVITSTNEAWLRELIQPFIETADRKIAERKARERAESDAA